MRTGAKPDGLSNGCGKTEPGNQDALCLSQTAPEVAGFDSPHPEQSFRELPDPYDEACIWQSRDLTSDHFIVATYNGKLSYLIRYRR